jgi:hypothetical protein
MKLKETECVDIDWVQLYQDKGQQWIGFCENVNKLLGSNKRQGTDQLIYYQVFQ